jgi:hypothetical protein
MAYTDLFVGRKDVASNWRLSRNRIACDCQMNGLLPKVPEGRHRGQRRTLLTVYL